MRVQVLQVERKNPRLTIAVIKAGELIGEAPCDPEVTPGEAFLKVTIDKKDGRICAPVRVIKLQEAK